MRQALPFTLHEMNIVPEITRQAAGEGDACLLFALEGRLIALVSHRRYVLHANDYILLGPEETARLATQGGARVLLLRMETAFLAGAGVGGEDLLAAFTPARLEENRLVTSQNNTNLLIRYFFQNLRRGATLPLGISYCHHLLALMAILVGRSAAHQPADGRGQHAFSINAVYYYVRDHLGEDLSLDTLAEKLYFNKYYIAHAFKRETGMSLHHYIAEKRMEHALTLLMQVRRCTAPLRPAAMPTMHTSSALSRKSTACRRKKYCRFHGERGRKRLPPPGREAGFFSHVIYFRARTPCGGSGCPWGQRRA